MSFKNISYAQALRDAIRDIASREIRLQRPSPKLAVVSTIDQANGTCTVLFPGDTEAVPVKMYTVQPLFGGGVPEYVANTSFEVDTSNWESNGAFGAYNSATLVRDTTKASKGTASLRLDLPGSTGGPVNGRSWANFFTTGNLTVGQEYEMRADVWVPSEGPDVGLDVLFKKSSPPLSTPKNQWYTLALPWVADATGVFLGIYADTSIAGQQIWIDNVSFKPIGAGAASGDVVRVEGEGGRRRVGDVVSGRPFIRAGRMSLEFLETTASSANMFVDSTTGIIQRVTSSLKYKRDVQNIGVPDGKFMSLRPVSYKDRTRFEDDTSYLGLIAEEIAELDDPILNQLVVFDKDGKPDAINYDRLAVVIIPVLQKLIARVAELESRVE